MTAHETGARAAAPTAPYPGLAARALPWWSTVAAIVVVAFGTRLGFMIHGGGILSVGAYDDGVYFAAANALVHGRLPYRDFLFLHPPGVILVTAPFAWLGSITTDPTGLAAARIAFMAAASVGSGLIAVVLRRFGYPAAVVGALVHAVGFIAVYSERSVMLGPWGTLCVLAALAVLARPGLQPRSRWLLLAGAFLGLAATVKIWYIVAAVVIVAFHWRSWRRLIAGGAAAITAVCLPFFLADPAGMFRQIVLDQTGRERSAPTLLYRLRFLLGGQSMPSWLGGPGGAGTTVLTVALVVLALAAIVAAWTVRDGRLYVCLFLADAALLLASPPFFVHYGTLTMPMLALVTGTAFGVLARVPRRAVGRATLTAAAVVCILLLNAGNLVSNTSGKRVPRAGLTAAASTVGGCVMSDDPTVLAVMNVLSRDLAAGCPLWPDVTGWTHDRYASASPRADDPAWQKALVDYLTGGSAVIVVRPETGLSPASLAMVTAGPVLYRHGPWVLHATAEPAG